MGCDFNAACNTCKVWTELGYGSATTWMIHCKTIAEFDANPSTNKHLAKNISWRAFLGQHDGHDFTVWSGDYSSVEDGKVILDDSSYVIVDLNGYSSV